MVALTQGSNLYAVDPADDSLITVGCITNLDIQGVTNEQIEITCLSDLVKVFTATMGTPGQFNFGINFDPADSTHQRLAALHSAGTTLLWAVGLADGTAAPTVDTGGTFDFATTRTFIRLSGFMVNFPLTLAPNSVVQSTVSVQQSGALEYHYKA